MFLPGAILYRQELAGALFPEYRGSKARVECYIEYPEN